MSKKRGSTAVFPVLIPPTVCPRCRKPIPGTDGQCPCQWGTFSCAVRTA